jgi:tRNA pseudouridine55 synthase
MSQKRSSSTRTDRQTAPDGIVVVDKPGGWTSHDVVGRMRRLAATRKVGHAGTLDPMATGVLVVGIGRATKLLTYIVGADKEYLATIRLGVTTVTDDAEGEITGRTDASGIDTDLLTQAVAELTGEIRQVPATVSAIKVDGKRAYARARAGEQVELAARPVTVSTFEIVTQQPAVVDGTAVLDVDVRVECSSGTYVRALARDLGAALGVGGHLTALRRTRVGGYRFEEARTLEELAGQVETDGVVATMSLVDAARAVLPLREVDEAEARALSYGQWIPATGATGPTGIVSPAGELIALVEDTRRGGASLAKPILVLAPA